MTEGVRKSLESVEVVYSSMEEVADDILKPFVEKINGLKKQMENVKELTNDQIRNLILLFSQESFTLADFKEYSLSKSLVAESLTKEKYAKAYSTFTGTEKATQGDRNSHATQETADEKVAEQVYDLVARLVKGKVDEAHRMVDSLKTVIMSRMQEAKLTMLSKETGEF